MSKPDNQSSECCPLCSERGGSFYADSKRGWCYYSCASCELVWMDRLSRPSRIDERAHYARHENDPEDAHYRDFLDRLWLPLKAKLKPHAEGLDYGSGPGPTLHLMAGREGYPCEHYDPVFHPDTEILNRRYDFITCSETAEHFHHPKREFAQLSGMLRPGGWLGLMTMRRSPETDFPNWHYRHDPTHVCFYSEGTLRLIARNFGFASVEFPSGTVALFRK